MRIGVVWVSCTNAYYRAIEPVTVMAGRGHEIVPPPDGDGDAVLGRLQTCDVVHVYRRSDEATRKILRQLTRAGTPITFDNDDDHTSVPKESPNYREWRGAKGQRVFAATVEVARMAKVFTTTNNALAEKYGRAGVERIEVIPNHVPVAALRPPRRNDGLVVGWVAKGEHYADAALIDIAGALRRLMEKHPHLRVRCIGVDLKLPGRYEHVPSVDYRQLPDAIQQFDIGIAPIADIPCNHARSDIKLKEYAAAGVPWLASPVGPYAAYGEDQGGRLVPDDGWFDALDRLVSQDRERTRLARRAQRWAKTQTIAAVADRWERVFAEAAGARVAPAARGLRAPSGGAIRVRLR